MVPRIAALLVLRTGLNEAYSRATADAYTAEELGIRKPPAIRDARFWIGRALYREVLTHLGEL